MASLGILACASVVVESCCLKDAANPDVEVSLNAYVGVIKGDMTAWCAVNDEDEEDPEYESVCPSADGCGPWDGNDCCRCCWNDCCGCWND